MSPTCEEFIKAVLRKDWSGAYKNLDRLSMYEQLRALAAIDRLDLDEMFTLSIQNSSKSLVDMPRIEFALSVVRNRRLPTGFSSTFKHATEQAIEATNCIRDPTRLWFDSDLTALLPKPNSAAGKHMPADFVAAAGRLGIEVGMMEAVVEVEAKQSFDNGRPF